MHKNKGAHLSCECMHK